MSHDIHALLELMRRLRAPDGGCPWDREQTFESIAPYTVEEAYEVADAIDRQAMDELRDELGDLLFQVVFHAQMAEEQGHFSFPDVVHAVVEKMTRRHPHVFADEQVGDAEEQTRRWEALKAEERRRKAEEEFESIFDGIARTLPAMQRAEKLQRRAARVGFDWPDICGPINAVIEELDELHAELEQVIACHDGEGKVLMPGADMDAVEDELGDLIFSFVNLARHAGIDPEHALRRANKKFERRFRAIEEELAAQGDTLEGKGLERLEELWAQAKSRVE